MRKKTFNIMVFFIVALVFPISWAKSEYDEVQEMIKNAPSVTKKETALLVAFLGGGNKSRAEESESWLFEDEGKTCETKCSAQEIVADNEQNAALLVFVSYSMPPKSLRKIVIDAHEYGARVILRGFVENSAAKTIQLTRQLFGFEHGVNIEISPQEFIDFGVDVVPAIVLATEGLFDKVSGDVSIDYALQIFSENGDLRKHAKKLQHI